MRITIGQLRRIIRESVGSYGGDPIDTITMYIEELHDSGDSAFTVWSKIAELDRKANKKRQRKISRHFTVTPVADVINPKDHVEIWKYWEWGDFLNYRDSIKHRLKHFIDEQSLQALADEISVEFGRMSVRKSYMY